jgi:PAS domain-containing protein
MSATQVQSVPSTDDYGKMTQLELEMRLAAAVKTMQEALALCTWSMSDALPDGVQNSLVGDITNALHACEATCRIRLYLRDLDKYYSFAFTRTMALAGLALSWVRNKLGASTMATCHFQLYYDIEATAKLPRVVISPDANVPRNLLIMESAFQSLLSSQNIVIVLFQNIPAGGIWFSSDSNQSSRPHQTPLIQKYLVQLHKSRLRVLRSSTDVDPTSAKVYMAALSGDHLQQRAGKVRNNLNDILNPQQIFTIVADYHGLTNFYAQAQLQKVAVRKDPQIQMSPVDMSCAFVVCNPSMHDCPIVYASPAFETLTGYAKPEVLFRNCRLLQSPAGQMLTGGQKQFASNQSLLELKHQIAQGREYQLTLINYKKGGQPFANLLTIVPILGDRLSFYVGFLIDIAEHPGCILGKNANGTYRVNYSTTQASKPFDAPTAPTDQTAPVLQRNGPAEPAELVSMTSREADSPGTVTDGVPAEPTELLAMTTPEADSPWTVTDGVPPPYALSPSVFYHTSRMGMLSP